MHHLDNLLSNSRGARSVSTRANELIAELSFLLMVRRVACVAEAWFASPSSIFLPSSDVDALGVWNCLGVTRAFIEPLFGRMGSSCILLVFWWRSKGHTHLCALQG